MSEEIQNLNESNVESSLNEETASTENTGQVNEEIQEKSVEKKKKRKITMEEIENELLQKQNNFDKFPEFSVGDTIRVNVKIVEGNKQRIQPYEGTVIAIKHGKGRKTFTVRRVSYGVAIERIFPFHSPVIDSIEVIRKGRVRRAKLYYLGKRYGRSAVITEKV